MNVPTRENDPTELDRFKRDIDLVDYATRSGYEVTKEGRNGHWHQLEKDGEKLIVTKKDDHQVYLNVGDDRDKGSIIDFAKTRGGDGSGLNLGQVRQELRGYLNDGPAPVRQYAEAPNVARLNALPVGDPNHERQAEEDRKTRLISEVLGVKKELTDRSYLHGRGIEDKTIDSPAFQGRIFTAQQNEHKNTAFPLYNESGLASVEQKNEHYKNLLPLPKNGIWVSHPTEGRDTPVARIIVSESAIDSLSHYQLKHEKDAKNTLYIATSGTPTEAQVALIQRVIDKQEPKEIVLANDRDAGGRQFNMNYMNELHPARPLVPVADQEAYKEASRPVEWHSTSDKYHTALKVSYHHDSAENGAAQVQQLTERVAKMNGTGEAGPTIEVEVQRSTERETVLRLSVAKADTAQLEVISQELYRQREQLRPEQERGQETFIRVDYPQAKDWNRDLELTGQGLNAEQIRAQAVLDEQTRAAEREQRRQQEEQQKQRQAEYATSAAMERDEQETRRQNDEKQKQQREQENTPEAQQKRQEEDKRFNQAVMGAAVADAGSPDDGKQFRSYRSEQEAAEHTAQFVHAKDAGLVLLKEYINDNPAPTGRKVDEAEQEELRGRARYAEPAAAINLPIGPPAEEKTATWKIDEVAANTTGRAEAWKEILDNSGYSMQTSEVRSTVDEQGIRRAEFDMKYRNDQPDIAIIHAIVTNTNARAEAGNEKYAGVSVAESEPDRAARQAAAEAAAIQPHNRDHSQDVADKPTAAEVQVSTTPAATPTAAAAEVQVAATPAAAPAVVIYLNAMPMPDGAIHDRDTSTRAASYSLYEIRVDAQNPNKAIIMPAADAHPQLVSNTNFAVRPVYDLTASPQLGEAYMVVATPTQVERTPQGWKITERGQAGFSTDRPIERSAGQERSIEPTPSEKEVASVSAQGSEKQVIIKVDEPALTAGERGQAEAVKAAITSSGAKAGDIQSTTDAQGIRHSEMKVSYRTDQPELAKISHTLDAVANQKGSHVIEHSSDRAERKDISRGQEMSINRTRTAEITR